MDNKKIIIGGGIVLAVLFFMSKKKAKPVVEATEELESESGGGGGGGGIGGGSMIGGGGLPMPPKPTPAPTPAPTPLPTPTPTPTITPTPTCRSNEFYNPATKKCEVTVSSGPIVVPKDVISGGGAGGNVVAYNPCSAYGGTYDAATNSCLKSPYCGGGTLKLNSSGQPAGCAVSVPTSGSVPAVSTNPVPISTSPVVAVGSSPTYGAVVTSPYSSSISTGGVYAAVMFSGKVPLTLDNLLM